MNQFDLPDTLKVLFEIHFNGKDQQKQELSFLSYFRMKMKGQMAMKFPENIENLKEHKNIKYSICESHKPKEIKENFQQSLKALSSKSSPKYYDEGIEFEDLGPDGYEKLFGLKHVDYLDTSDLLDMKAKVLFQKEFEEIKTKEHIENSEMNNITKEILYTNFLLNEFVVPENNLRKEKVMRTNKEDDQSHLVLHRLQE